MEAWAVMKQMRLREATLVGGDERRCMIVYEQSLLVD